MCSVNNVVRDGIDHCSLSPLFRATLKQVELHSFRKKHQQARAEDLYLYIVKGLAEEAEAEKEEKASDVR